MTHISNTDLTIIILTLSIIIAVATYILTFVVKGSTEDKH